MGSGHIELERALDSIVIGRRHRSDLGDLDTLAASIERDGLLQPPTVTPEGVLVCGARRIAALKRLGWRTVNVWVRSGITDRLGQLLAEQDDNVLHKRLTDTEAATLYRELKAVMAEDAARRQEATRFTTNGQNGSSHGAADSAAPSETPVGDARAQAARMVTSRASYTKLEQINRLHELATDPDQPDTVRDQAAAELARIDAGASANSAYQRVNAHLSLAELDRLATDDTLSATARRRASAEAATLRAHHEDDAQARELERLAAEALDRVRTAGNRRAVTKRARAATNQDEEPAPARFPVRAFIHTWDDLAGWWTHYDAAEIAAALTEQQWASFETTVTQTAHFAEQVRAARDNHTRTGRGDDEPATT